MGMFSRRKPSMGSKPEAAFPIRPLFILALCRICEPIAFTSIFPYIYYMIRDFNITDDEKQISIYAGMVTSAFAIAEFTASIFWGWLSDKIGRKPVLLTGLAGTGISMLAFGFAKSLPIALLARTVGGLLNGNIGVIITTVGEVVTEESHQSRAFAIMPFVWCLGSIIGGVLGGSLAQPAKSWSLFDTQLFRDYPYLLPNLVCTAVVALGVVVGFLFLEETHEDKRTRKDVGIKLGQKLLRSLSCRRPRGSHGDVQEQETHVFSASDEKGDYHIIPTSPQMTATTSHPDPSETHLVIEKKIEPRVPFYRSLTRQIKLIIISYGLLAFHTITLESLLPILFASEPSTTETVFPFKFTGGFNLTAKQIGLILSLQGVVQMIAQIAIFPFVNQRFGSLVTYRIAVISYPLLYFLTPYLALVPRNLRYPCIVVVLVWKVTAQSFSFPSQSIMLANSAPSKRVLGTLNGVAMAAASLARAFSPTIIGFIHAVGSQAGYSIFSWWTCSLVAIIGATVSMLMSEPIRETAAVVPQDEEKAEARPLLASARTSCSEEIDPNSCQSEHVDQSRQ